MNESLALQTKVFAGAHGSVMAMDSAYDVREVNRGRDVVVNASYCGVLPARFIAEHAPRGAIGIDCAVGPAGASIAGLWYLEARDIAACVADVATVRLGDGRDLHDNGVVSFLNQPAADRGICRGMAIREAARLMLDGGPQVRQAAEVTNRTVVATAADGRQVVCLDSIAFGGPEDARNVLVTAGHTGRSAVPYLRRVLPHGFICSDGGMGRDRSGIAGLAIVEADGLAGATVDARTARMGDGLSSYRDGVVSAANALARAAGIAIGMPAAEAAALLLHRDAG